MTLTKLVLIPAYGRQYSTAEAARRDWEDGKDFKVPKGSYTSIRDLLPLQAAAQCVAICWNINDLTQQINVIGE